MSDSTPKSRVDAELVYIAGAAMVLQASAYDLKLNHLRRSIIATDKEASARGVADQEMSRRAAKATFATAIALILQELPTEKQDAILELARDILHVDNARIAVAAAAETAQASTQAVTFKSKGGDA